MSVPAMRTTSFTSGCYVHGQLHRRWTTTHMPCERVSPVPSELQGFSGRAAATTLHDANARAWRDNYQVIGFHACLFFEKHSNVYCLGAIAGPQAGG
jgi:hypothetical protein